MSNSGIGKTKTSYKAVNLSLFLSIALTLRQVSLTSSSALNITTLPCFLTGLPKNVPCPLATDNAKAKDIKLFPIPPIEAMIPVFPDSIKFSTNHSLSGGLPSKFLKLTFFKSKPSIISETLLLLTHILGQHH